MECFIAESYAWFFYALNVGVFSCVVGDYILSYSSEKMHFIFIKYIFGSRGKKVSCELAKISSYHMVPSYFIYLWLNFSQIQCSATYKCNHFQHSDRMMTKLLLLLLLLLLLFELFKII